jgi:uncharacterized membrane protein
MTATTAQVGSTYDAANAGLAPGRPRIQSVDVLRGIVMVLMAIDHVRVYSGVPAGGPTLGVFFTRWITHFCAPAFVFFAGTSAFLYAQHIGGTSQRPLARWLVTRGALLVVLELTLVKLSWGFNLNYSFVLAGVIWMLGWCMILMGGLVFLPTKWVGIVGLTLILVQQAFYPLFSALRPMFGPAGAVFDFLYLGNQSENAAISILYVIIPWIGVMAAGYAFGAILTMEPERRKKLCYRIGGGATIAFIAIAAIVAATQPARENAPPFIIRMLNQQKYPASQLYLMMTLGPTILLVPFFERVRSRFTDVMATFGRVPMWYYLWHIPVIHVLSLIVMRIKFGDAFNTAVWNTAPFTGVPQTQRWSLALLYLVFAIAIAILYPISKWYAGLKSRRRDAWLKYI